MSGKKLIKKTSVGIAVCRYHPETKIPEIYLIKNRISYSFSNFILGRFNTSMRSLMDKMTVNEKCLIRTGDFDIMWNHIWLGTLDDKKLAFYNNQKRQFYKKSTEQINKAINNSKSQELGWEIPKGRIERNEDMTSCAMREIEEETGADPFQYHIIGSAPKISYSYQISNTVFNIKYFVAKLIGDIPNGVDMSCMSQVVEASDAKWVALRDLPYMNMQHMNTSDVIKKCITVFKKSS